MTEESAAAWTAPMPPPRPISDAELAFLSTYTGIADLTELRAHLLTMWNKAVSGCVCLSELRCTLASMACLETTGKAK
jgi:hypothetical protein